MESTNKVLTTGNEDWGFWGTMMTDREQLGKTQEWVAEEWTKAFNRISSLNPNWTPVMVRDWLDSRSGRHFANDAMNCNGVDNVPIHQHGWDKDFRIFAAACR